MLIRMFIIMLFMYNGLFSNENKGAKFLVLDNSTYSMIENLNILNGGIEKKVIISSTRLDEDTIKKYYPEYFLFKGEKCSIINTINATKSRKKALFVKLVNEKDIKTEIKKIKLLQILNDDTYSKGNYSIVSLEILKSLSLTCNGKLLFRNKMYQIGSSVGKFKIEKIDSKNSILYIKE